MGFVFAKTVAVRLARHGKRPRRSVCVSVVQESGSSTIDQSAPSAGSATVMRKGLICEGGNFKDDAEEDKCKEAPPASEIHPSAAESRSGRSGVTLALEPRALFGYLASWKNTSGDPTRPRGSV